MLDELPSGVMGTIVDLLAPADVLRLMSTCRSWRGIGRHAGAWTGLRRQLDLEAPEGCATEGEDDHAIITPRLCKLCWQAVPLWHGLCNECIDADTDLSMLRCILDIAQRKKKLYTTLTFYRFTDTVAFDQRMLQESIENIGDAKEKMEERVARMQMLGYT